MKIIDNIPWTKLNKDGIWNHAAMKYMNPTGRTYHNMQHIVDLYSYAQELKIPYDINLDVAILFHDIVYDKEDNKEIRSAYDFYGVVKNVIGNLSAIPEKVFMPFGVIQPEKVADYILTTINHAPMSNEGQELVLLDLYGFADNNKRKQNFVNLMDEIENLYEIEVDKNILFKVHQNLLRIYGNLVYYVTANPDAPRIETWNAIIQGIEKQAKEIEALVQKELDKEKRFKIVK